MSKMRTSMTMNPTHGAAKAHALRHRQYAMPFEGTPT